jgi:hypothetical protein
MIGKMIKLFFKNAILFLTNTNQILVISGCHAFLHPHKIHTLCHIFYRSGIQIIASLFFTLHEQNIVRNCNNPLYESGQ